MVHAHLGRHWATRRVRWFELAAFVLAGLAPTPAGAQLAVDQAEIFLEPRTVGRGIASINVSNEGDSVAEARVYLSDWDRREDGSIASIRTAPCRGRARACSASSPLVCGLRPTLRRACAWRSTAPTRSARPVGASCSWRAGRRPPAAAASWRT